MRHALAVVLSSLLTAAQAAPPDSLAAAAQAPSLAEMRVAPQQLAPVLQRYARDLASVEHVQDVAWGERRHAALDAFHAAWRARLDEFDYASLGLEDRIDWQLLARELEQRRAELAFERERWRQAEPLLDGIAPLLALAEARRRLEYPEPRAAAATLERSRVALVSALERLEAPAAKGTKPPSPAVAARAARIVAAARASLKGWYDFHAGYDPQFTWWNAKPWQTLDTLLGEYAEAVKSRLAGGADPELIVGDPIGREALLRGLAHELIAYTPEELLRLAERELAWCQEEMRKAAAELGFADWKQALEHVKSRHVEPGEQPRLVVELADEAIAFLDRHQLVTVPPLARRDWRMTMLDAEAQLQAPFFLGGRDVWVAYPTADMPFDKKLDALRGNNRHFSRAVVHHELIPGHHLQHFYNERWQPQRSAVSETPFWVEGWALYWEFLLWDRGFARTPEDRIGMLFWRSHRAARILFSLAFHLGRMSPQEAVDLLVERVGHQRENAAAEVRRSFAGDYGPLYQAAYMLGGLQFRALHAERVGGAKMNERDFHDAILKGGPMPVELVRARLRGTPPPRDLTASWRFYPLD